MAEKLLEVKFVGNEKKEGRVATMRESVAAVYEKKGKVKIVRELKDSESGTASGSGKGSGKGQDK